MKSTMITATILASSMSLYGHAQAQEAPWGCEVLLCAASSTPSWHGVSYCVPPMTKLIAVMKLPGFSWPICPGAGTGAPGIQVYEECPVGFQPMKETDGNGRGTYGESCVKPDVCSGHGDNKNCYAGEKIPRPMKADPYYFDINNGEGKTDRHWFNLRY